MGFLNTKMVLFGRISGCGVRGCCSFQYRRSKLAVSGSLVEQSTCQYFQKLNISHVVSLFIMDCQSTGPSQGLADLISALIQNALFTLCRPDGSAFAALTMIPAQLDAGAFVGCLIPCSTTISPRTFSTSRRGKNPSIRGR